MTLTLTQTGSSVTGTLTLGNIVKSVTGSVSADGHLVLNGSVSMTISGLPVTFTIVGWDTTQSGTSMQGGWSERLTSTVVPGFVQWINTINSVTKGAANQPVASSSEGWSQSGETFAELLKLTRPAGN